MSSTELYADYKTKMQKIADVKYASAVLQWDQETYLPPNGQVFRGRQLATLNEMAHEHFIDDQMRSLLNRLNATSDLTAKEKRNVELSLVDYNRNKKFTPGFVRKLSETVNKSFHKWIEARKENSFRVFQNALEEVISLKIQEADIIGYTANPYDALINDYDKGLTVAEIDNLFTTLRPSLKNLLDLIKQFPQVDDSFLKQYYPKETQWNFGMNILGEIGFDFSSGRQDISEHPFTTSFNNKDVRVTTRIDEMDLGNMIWSCIHEGGHGMYEQGLPESEYGLPLGEYCSLSIHESQSRLWENCIGRGMDFWEKHYPLLQKSFPEQLQKVSLTDFYKGINKVQPSLIRTEADELTYHFHVMIRYELEKQLMEGSIKTKEIPEFWNAKYDEYLGIKVPDDKNGCLQDVHWSHGSIGYFPTYTIGSLYASQIFEAINRQGVISENLPGNRNKSILKWLKQQIFSYGRYYNSGELCREATGETLNSEYFISYAKQKFTKIYVP